jgi:hypothetical protein
VPLITDYMTLAELRDYRRITAPGDTADDAVMQIAITAASRAIDTHCNRRFGRDSPAVARPYSWAGEYLEQPVPAYRPTGLNTPGGMGGRFPILEVDDISGAAGVVVKTDGDGDGVYETSLTVGTDFKLWPLNAAADGEPYTHVVLHRGGAFPWMIAGVEVTAAFGWAAVPIEVAQACRLQANRLTSRRDSWSGVAGSPEMGNELRLLSKLDPDLGPLLTGRRRIWLAG